MTGPQKIVQAAHAAQEAGNAFEQPEESCHIVLIGVKNQEKLLEAAEYLEEHGIQFKMFYEPDYDTGYTAIATEVLRGDERKCLKKFKLYKE